MRVVSVNPADPRSDRLDDAVRTLQAGGVVALPTETLYGLSASGFDSAALARVNRLKRKPADSPILLLLADVAQVAQVADALPALFARLAEAFWPGPLTLVVPSSASVPPEVTGGRGTVAVRVPGLALPRRVAARLGHPISGVSANVEGQPPCRTASEVARTFADDVEMILDGGPTPAGAPSTILDLTAEWPRVVREGLVPLGSLRPFLGGPEDGPAEK